MVPQSEDYSEDFFFIIAFTELLPLHCLFVLRVTRTLIRLFVRSIFVRHSCYGQNTQGLQYIEINKTKRAE